MKVVIIGAGDAGSQHAEALRLTPSAELVAVADLDGEAAGKLAAEHHVPTATIDEALSGRLSDAVALCTPPGGRSAAVVTAAENGLAVVVEKPTALSIRELDEIIAASDKAAVPIATMHQHRMALLPYLAQLDSAPDFSRAVGVACISRFRTPGHYRGRTWRTQSALSGGGVLAHLGVHYLDLACQLLGMPVSVQTISRFDHETLEEVDTRAALSVAFDSGALLAAYATTFSSGVADYLRVEAPDIRVEFRGGAVEVVSGDRTLNREGTSIAELRAAVYSELAQAVGSSSHRLTVCDVRQSAGVVRILESYREQAEGRSA